MVLAAAHTIVITARHRHHSITYDLPNTCGYTHGHDSLDWAEQRCYSVITHEGSLHPCGPGGKVRRKSSVILEMTELDAVGSYS